MNFFTFLGIVVISLVLVVFGFEWVHHQIQQRIPISDGNAVLLTIGIFGAWSILVGLIWG